MADPTNATWSIRLSADPTEAQNALFNVTEALKKAGEAAGDVRTGKGFVGTLGSGLKSIANDAKAASSEILGIAGALYAIPAVASMAYGIGSSISEVVFQNTRRNATYDRSVSASQYLNMREGDLRSTYFSAESIGGAGVSAKDWGRQNSELAQKQSRVDELMAKLAAYDVYNVSDRPSLNVLGAAVPEVGVALDELLGDYNEKGQRQGGLLKDVACQRAATGAAGSRAQSGRLLSMQLNEYNTHINEQAFVTMQKIPGAVYALSQAIRTNFGRR